MGGGGCVGTLWNYTLGELHVPHFVLHQVGHHVFVHSSKVLFLSFSPKLKEDYDSIRESHTKLEIQVKTSEMELENQSKRSAQLEGEIKGKVCTFN